MMDDKVELRREGKARGHERKREAGLSQGLPSLSVILIPDFVFLQPAIANKFQTPLPGSQGRLISAYLVT